MCTGRLGDIVAAKHRIELKLVGVPKHQVRYGQALAMKDEFSKYIIQEPYFRII